MAQSLSRLWTHLIFSTKNRCPFLSERAERQRVHAYLATVLRNQECEVSIVGGTADHVHALFTLPRTHSVSEIVKETKHASSTWIKTLSPHQVKFRWQNGYAAFSVSESHVESVRRYIENQEQRHRRAHVSRRIPCISREIWRWL
jgi:REP element-mobilizing transposase RayT